MLTRTLIVLGVLMVYAAMRSIIFYYFMGGGLEFFDWWASWWIAVPATFALIFFPTLAILFIMGKM